MVIHNETLISLLIEHCESDRLHISIPAYNWTFASDNINDVEPAITSLINPTVIIIKQLTSIDSAIAYKNDSSKFLPIKNVTAGVVHNNETEFLSPECVRESFETCAETGQKLPPAQDFVYVEAQEIIKPLAFKQ